MIFKMSTDNFSDLVKIFSEFPGYAPYLIMDDLSTRNSL